MRTYIDQIRAIIWKDLVLELRTRERIAAMGAFAVLAAILFNFSIDTTSTRPEDVAAGLIWMTLVFGGLLGVGRTFYLESQDNALLGLLTSPVPKDAIYLAKTLANFALLFIVSVLVLGVFALFFGLDLGANVGGIILVLGLGSLGFVALGTLFAAISTGTTMGETLLPILVFPLLVPMVIYGVTSTGRLIAGRPFDEVEGNVRMLGAFAVAALAAGAMLFRYVVED
ncbi:MAG: heme exporter protein CcmB [Gemmatimonadetes bacterium]|nr:heme exporter protein CcmB [Gemmatimonadota bacterium]MDA1104205.1 heme exporter protein CcmB [Gemmatimonadota bacterium]